MDWEGETRWEVDVKEGATQIQLGIPCSPLLGLGQPPKKKMAEEQTRERDFTLLHLNPSNCDVDDQSAFPSLLSVILRLPRLCNLAWIVYLSTLPSQVFVGRLVHGVHGVHSTLPQM